MIHYFYPISPHGAWLIRPEPGNSGSWQLVLLGPGEKEQVVSSFPFPHQASYALVTFQTGNADWDSIPVNFPGMAAEYGRQGLHDLKKWHCFDVP